MASAKQEIADARQLYSGLIRLHILHHAAERGIFGLGMIEELARHGYKLSPGTLYPILHGLQEVGLLRSYEVCIKGKIRRVYRITAEGQKALSAAKEKVRELFGELFEDETGYKQRRTPPRVVSVPVALYPRRRASHTTV
jgi:DNA-binding PadR family transcriptional regulator